MPNKIIEFFKEKLKDIKDEKRKVSIAKACDFAKLNRNCLIFLLDIKTDDMVAAFKDKYMAARIVSGTFKRKTGLAKSIILGKGDTRKRNLDIMQFKEFIAEFLWQIPDKLNPKVGGKEQKQKHEEEKSQSN